jgi:hypothetical protein
MMGSKLHVPVFLKESTVEMLINCYEAKTEPAIYESLLDLISVL